MNNNTKGAIAVGVTLGVVGLAYYFLVYKKDGNGQGDAYSGLDNFNSLQTNLGLKAGKDNVLIVPFNEKKNTAQFYTNNRVVFFDNNKVVVKGSYANGGQSISLDGGREVSGGSVWQNLRDVINTK